jgi:hypothetical protein
MNIDPERTESGGFAYTFDAIPEDDTRQEELNRLLQSKLQTTREKLRVLEEVYAKTQAEPTENAYARELTLRSLRRTINELKAEIARFEPRAGSVTDE